MVGREAVEEDSRLPSDAVLNLLELCCCQPEYMSVPSAEHSQNLHDVLNQAVLLLFSYRKATQSQCRLQYAAAASETAWACYGLHTLQPQRVAQETKSHAQHPTLIATSTYIHPSREVVIAPHYCGVLFLDALLNGEVVCLGRMG